MPPAGIFLPKRSWILEVLEAGCASTTAFCQLGLTGFQIGHDRAAFVW